MKNMKWLHYILTNPSFIIRSILTQKIKPTQTSLCSASYIGWKRRTPRICCCAPYCGAAAADRRPAGRAAIDHSSKPASAACSRQMGQTDRQTDGRTDPRQLHRPRSVYYASVYVGIDNNLTTSIFGLYRKGKTNKLGVHSGARRHVLLSRRV